MRRDNRQPTTQCLTKSFARNIIIAHTNYVRYVVSSKLKTSASSPQANLSRKYPTSIGGGALLEVTQGATVAISWICVDGFGAPCSSTLYSTWSAQTVPPGLTAAFTPVTTVGAGATTEAFTASTTAPPGLYPASSCLTSSGYDTLGTTVCINFIISVESSNIAPVPSPPVSAGQTVKLQIAPAISGSQPIAGQGHLYFAFYTNGILTSEEQSGPYGPLLALRLYEQKYTEFAYSDPGIDITPYISQQNVVYWYDVYLGYQGGGQAPSYNALSFNSNTWADGLLLVQGIPQSTITGWLNRLSALSGLGTTAAPNGSIIEPCFQPIGRIGFVRLRRATSIYGGCTIPHSI